MRKIRADSVADFIRMADSLGLTEVDVDRTGNGVAPWQR